MMIVLPYKIIGYFKIFDERNMVYEGKTRSYITRTLQRKSDNISDIHEFTLAFRCSPTFNSVESIGLYKCTCKDFNALYEEDMIAAVEKHFIIQVRFNTNK